MSRFNRLPVILAAGVLIMPGGDAMAAARYSGGIRDGFSSAGFTGAKPPIGGETLRFTAVGGYDGYGSGRFTSFDPPAGGTRARFVSNSGSDGYASAAFDDYTQPVGGTLTRFIGGGGFDGYTSSHHSLYLPPVGGELPRFLGGHLDGYASSPAVNMANPLSGDSDGDLVPDWWESLHYRSLTACDSDTDLDHDGKGSLEEYLADTDPLDPASYLRILDVRLGAEVEIDFGPSSIRRIYWLEGSRSLHPGDWTQITSPKTPGNGGNTRITTPVIWSDQAFFRVRVAVD